LYYWLDTSHSKLSNQVAKPAGNLLDWLDTSHSLNPAFLFARSPLAKAHPLTSQQAAEVG
jgi:hypothetical protein